MSYPVCVFVCLSDTSKSHSLPLDCPLLHALTSCYCCVNFELNSKYVSLVSDEVHDLINCFKEQMNKQSKPEPFLICV